MSPGRADTIDELAERVHRWIALNDLLFESLGAWARSGPEPPVKRLFATWCHRHAWHAQLWRARLPTYQGRADADVLAERWRTDTAEWIEPLQRALTDAGEASTDAKRTALIEAVLPAMVDALDDHRAAIDERLDGPTARVLDLVGVDLAAERAAFAR